MSTLRVLLAIGAAVTLWRLRRWSNSIEQSLKVTGILALALPLIGTLSEIHYGVLAFPVTACMITGRLGAVAQIAALAGSVLQAVGISGLGDAASVQLILCTAQVVVMLGTIVATQPPSSTFAWRQPHMAGATPSRWSLGERVSEASVTAL